MRRRLFWKLCTTVAAGTVLLFWAINHLASHTEQRMSFIADEHQRTLVAYGRKAESLYLSGDEAALAAWLRELQTQEDTWAAVVQSELRPIAGSSLSQQFVEGFRLGRHVEWKIHLYFTENPIMDITFTDGHTHFLIRLPQRMRPGSMQPYIGPLLKVLLPLSLLILLSVVLYRHVMGPLRRLERATRQFSDGLYDVRVANDLGNRRDELTGLAESFDHMAERTGSLIRSQRHLIADLSHELRTPLTRIDMALSLSNQTNQQEILDRIKRDSAQMRALVEDSLTLAWLENERPRLDPEDLDLTDLTDSILDDARFEFPQHRITALLPDHARLCGSSQRLLGQALENIVRNALHYTPPGGQVSVTLTRQDEEYRIQISDQGPGVPEAELRSIFRPFYRVDRSRHNEPRGYGLGLALALRQVEAVAGSLRAFNAAEGGLCMEIRLPCNTGHLESPATEPQAV
ncbi:sensor histidine kinase [Marinobacterium mangrovicola]|uniref:histidine kinase n=1 Tax=Marinobacterium mangrovicola TaxID=1476959 RepID=A0A4R1GWU6_9GAMM|nr:sensor histidine kinase [Marinobacterium mangrovicola]TCK08902.1 two-component system sensor histidine kinase PfeS [Marinobacterium mangrovicola]